MNELTTLPTSVRLHLERANTLASQSRGNEATAAFSSAAVTLARTNPELCGLLVAAALGFTELTVTQTDTHKETTRTAKRVMGVKYGEDVSTSTKSNTSTRKISFSDARRNRY
jgi:hypothetical protein